MTVKVKKIVEIVTIILAGGMVIYGTSQISGTATWFIAAGVLILAEAAIFGDKNK